MTHNNVGHVVLKILGSGWTKVEGSVCAPIL
jgi:hypothetical protein